MTFQRSGRRTAPSPHSLNKNSDFYDKFGHLKDGYSYEGGEGMIAMGEGKVGTTRGAGKDGMVGGTINKMIYGKAPQALEPKPIIPSEPAAAPSKSMTESTDPIEYSFSPEIIHAQKNVDEYKDKVKTGEISRSIYRNPESEQAAQSFLDMKKYQFMGL